MTALAWVKRGDLDLQSTGLCTTKEGAGLVSPLCHRCFQLRRTPNRASKEAACVFPPASAASTASRCERKDLRRECGLGKPRGSCGPGWGSVMGRKRTGSVALWYCG
jgi:hypothetical protein